MVTDRVIGTRKGIGHPQQGCRLTKNNKQLNRCRKVEVEVMMVLVMSTGVMASSRREFVDGTPCAVKIARTVWSGGK